MLQLPIRYIVCEVNEKKRWKRIEKPQWKLTRTHTHTREHQTAQLKRRDVTD